MPIISSNFWIEELNPSKHGSPIISRGSFGDISIAIQIPKGNIDLCNKSNHTTSSSKDVSGSDDIISDTSIDDSSDDDSEETNKDSKLKVRFVVIKRIPNSFVPMTNYPVITSSNDDNMLDKPKKVQYQLSHHASSELKSLYILSNQIKYITPLLSLNDMYPGGDSISLVFPYQPTDLSTVILHKREENIHSDKYESYISDIYVKRILKDVLTGLVYCHSNNISHNDIKPANLLLTSRGYIQLSDFGMSRVHNLKDKTITKNSSSSLRLSSLHYQPPELLFGSTIYNGTSVDIWSCALVACELLTLETFLPGSSKVDQLSRVFDVFGTPNEDTWPGVTTLPDYYIGQSLIRKDGINLSQLVDRIKKNGSLDTLLSNMLFLNPSKRSNAKDCLKNSWFHEYPLPAEKELVARTLMKEEWEVADSLSISKSYKNEDLEVIFSMAGDIAANRRSANRRSDKN